MAVETHTGPVEAPERTPTGISVAAGSVLLVLATVAAAALFPGAAVAPRLAVLGLVVAGFAVLVADLWAVLSVAVLSVLVFTGFLANRYGELTARHGDVWWYALAIGSAALLGAACRAIRTGTLARLLRRAGEVLAPADPSPLAGRRNQRPRPERPAEPARNG